MPGPAITLTAVMARMWHICVDRGVPNLRPTEISIGTSSMQRPEDPRRPQSLTYFGTNLITGTIQQSIHYGTCLVRIPCLLMKGSLGGWVGRKEVMPLLSNGVSIIRTSYSTTHISTKLVLAASLLIDWDFGCFSRPKTVTNTNFPSRSYLSFFTMPNLAAMCLSN